MKKYSLGLLFIVTVFTLNSCTEDNALEDQRELDAQSILNNGKTLVGTPIYTTLVNCSTIKLMAGQHYEAGMVQITADIDNIYVTYKTGDDWRIDTTHLYVGDCDLIPITRSGNPKIGHFPDSAEHPSGTIEVSYTISKADLDDSFCMVAHANLSKLDAAGNIIQAETAWAEGFSFGGSNWAMYQEVAMSGCYLRPEEPLVRR